MTDLIKSPHMKVPGARLAMAALAGALLGLAFAPPAARGEEDEARRAQCRQMAETASGMGSRYRQTAQKDEDALAKYNALRGEWATRHKSYLDLRDSANDLASRQRALGMWDSLHQAWQARQSSASELLSIRRERLAAWQRYVAHAKSMVAAGCVSSTALSKAEGFMQKLQESVARTEGAYTSVSKPWRTSADKELVQRHTCDKFFNTAPVKEVFEKVEEKRDYVAPVLQLTGEAFVSRGIRSSRLRQGDQLKPGDVIKIEHDSWVKFDLYGLKEVTLYGLITLEMPTPGKSTVPRSLGIATQAWIDFGNSAQKVIKKLLIEMGGDLFGACGCPSGYMPYDGGRSGAGCVKSIDATAGVRG